VAEPVALIAMTARLGRAQALSDRIAAAFGAPLPGPLRWTAGPRWRFVWTGAGQWLATAAMAPDAAPDAALDDLTAAAGAEAALVDQSDAWARFVLTGPQARARLARLAPIDLHASAFPADAAARTVVEHIAMLLIARPDDAIEALAPRSTAADAAAVLQADPV
jgi:sarcosine oxidase subunit gamma